MEKFQYYMLNGSVKVPEKLNSRIFGSNSLQNPILIIENLKKVNIFVGPNNSGKSFLFRELTKNFEDSYVFSNEFIVLFRNVVDRHIEILENFIQMKYSKDLKTEKYEILYNIPDLKSNSSNSNSFYHLNDLIDFNILNNNQVIKLLKRLHDFKNFWETQLDKTQFKAEIKFTSSANRSEAFDVNIIYEFLNAVFNDNRIEEMVNYLITIQDSVVFINHFRYLSDFQKADSIIANLFKSIYEFPDDSQANFTLVSGFELIKSISESFKTVNSFKRILEFQNFLSQNFFDSKDVYFVQTNNYKRNETDTKEFNEIQIQIGNENPKFIQELGTGIQMLIILTWPLFQKDFGTIFIEEPELYLHPGLQRKLMEIFSNHNKSKNFQFYISTHSNHIIEFSNFTQDLCSVYKIKKAQILNSFTNEPVFFLDQIESKNIDILTELGVRNSSVYIANCTIWVEGITDVMYIRTYLKYYLESKNESMKFLENLHFAFLEYAGGLIEHWNFEKVSKEEIAKIKAFSISNKILLIIDQDDPSKKRKRKKRLSDELKDHFYMLPVREIENTLPAYVIEKLIDKVDIYKTLNEKLYVNEKIGKYIDDKIIDGSKKYENKITSKKADFARECIRIIDQHADSMKNAGNFKIEKLLSASARNLCEKIYKFIEESNQN